MAGQGQGTPSPLPVPLRLERIATQAQQYPDMAFTTLAHYLDVAMLTDAFRRLNPRSAPGVDRVTWRRYKENLASNLDTLHKKLVNDTYSPQPVVRRLIPKSNGTLRPLGLPALEDKIVAKAVAMLLEAIVNFRQASLTSFLKSATPCLQVSIQSLSFEMGRVVRRVQTPPHAQTPPRSRY
jgi:hypothetical protein